MTRPGHVARAAGVNGRSGRWSSGPPTGGLPLSVAEDFRDVGHDVTDFLVGQLALVSAVDLDRAAVPHEDRDVRVPGDLVVGGPVGALADGEWDVLDAGLV